MNTAQLEAPVAKDRPAPAGATSVPMGAPPRRKWWVYLILALVLIGFGFFVYHLITTPAVSAADLQKAKGGQHDLPVVSAMAYRGDLNQYLIGLGTVTPLSTVTLKSRVDGAITEIGFKEGQMVEKDQFLLQIDPRPYEAALKQAQGQYAKDKAAEIAADWSVKQDEIALKDKGISQQQMINDTGTRDQAAGAMLVDQANIDSANLNITYAHITSPIAGKIGLRLVDLGNIVHAADTSGLVVITQLQPITVVFNLPEDDIAEVEKHSVAGQPLVVDAYDRDLTKKLATGSVLAIDNEIDPTTGTVRIKAQFDNNDHALFPSQFVNARLRVDTIHDAVLVPAAAIQHSPTSTFAYVIKKASTTQPAPTEAMKDPASDGKSDPGASGGGGGKRTGTKDSGPPRIKGTVNMRELTVGPTQAAIGSEGVDTTVVLSGLEPGDIVVTDGVDKLTEGSGVIATPAAAPTAGKHATTGPSTAPAGSEPTTQMAHHRKHGGNAE